MGLGNCDLPCKGVNGIESAKSLYFSADGSVISPYSEDATTGKKLLINFCSALSKVGSEVI